MWVFHSLRKIYIFICNRLIKIYIVYETEPTI